MRYLYAFAATVLAAALIFAFFPSSEDAAVYDDILRLHVIAASDSEVDQATKLAVRDALLEKTAPILAGCTSRDEAAERLGEASALLERTAAEVVASRGGDYGATVLLGRNATPPAPMRRQHCRQENIYLFGSCWATAQGKTGGACSSHPFACRPPRRMKPRPSALKRD